jgi:superfamily I DNA and/or RNA helicase
MNHIKTLQKLHEILSVERKIAQEEVKSRGTFRGSVVGGKRGYYLISTSKGLTEGTLLGTILDGNPVELGYVIRVEETPKGYIYLLKAMVEPEGEVELIEMENLISYDLQLDVIKRYLDEQNFPEVRIPDESDEPEFEFLDEYQRNAVGRSLCLGDNEIMPVIGPPGTGKTTFIASAVLSHAKRNGTVLISSHTNRAVDNAIEKISQISDLSAGEVVRVAHDWKISPSVRRFSLRYIAERELGESFDKLPIEEMAEKYRTIERKSLEILSRASIIGSTLIKSAMHPLIDYEFDIVFVDESSQALISSALLAIEKSSKSVMVGDPYQLPPVLRRYRDSTYFGAFNFFFSGHRTLWLRNHYRSNEKIIGFSAKYIYGGKIIPHEVCKDIKLEVKSKSNPLLDSEKPVVFVSLNSVESGRGSKRNYDEAIAVRGVCSALVEEGVKEEDIGVITPYLAQKQLLRSMIGLEIEVDTVDAYQGREKDVVVFSTTAVRDLRFACEKRRFNVAVTRARKKLIVFGNRRSFLIPQNRNSLLYQYYLYAKENDGYFEISTEFDFKPLR